MQFNLDSESGKYQITSYKPGQVIINKQIYTRSIIVTAEQLMSDWPPQSFTDLTVEHLRVLLNLAPQIVILGTGENQYFLAQELILLFLQQGIGIEVMNTDAACRTYNVLMSEGRNVIAALLLK